MRKVITMTRTNKDILEIQIDHYKDMLKRTRKENHDLLPVINYFRNDYEEALFTVVTRPFSPEEKYVTFATPLLLNAILPVDKVSITMDANVSMVDKEEEVQEMVSPSKDPSSLDIIFSTLYQRDGKSQSEGLQYTIKDKTGDLVFHEDSREMFSQDLSNESMGGAIADIVFGSFAGDSELLNQLTEVDTDKERTEEYFMPIMQLLDSLDYLVMCSESGINFLKSLGIEDTPFISAEDYNNITKEEE